MATLTGDAGNNTLTGTSGNDSISGLGGDDRLNGVNGNDIIDGGDGNDSLGGDNGNDTVLGGTGADTIADWLGANSLDGGPGNDLFGAVAFSGANTGADTISGGTGSDIYAAELSSIISTPVADTILDFEAGAGGDVIDLTNVPFGPVDPNSNGNPFVGLIRLVQSGSDTLFQVDLSGNSSPTGWKTALILKNTTKASFTAANFSGHGYNFDPQTTGVVYTGDAGNNSLLGGNGDDTVFGNDGNDTVAGGNGNDLLSAGNGNDSIWGDAGQDTLLGGAGNDTFFYPGGNDSVDGGDGNDSIISGTGNNTILGGAGADSIDDTVGANLIDGGDGDDQFMDVSYTDSTEGNDTFSGGTGRDTYVFPFQALTSPITSDTITDFETGPGGDLLDITNLMAVLSGFPENGNPFLDGYLRLLQNGPDILFQADANGPAGGANWVTMLTFANSNAASFTADNFTTPNNFNPQSRVGDSLVGDAGANSLTGSPNDDTIFGGAGNDSIDARAGNDSIDAGDGNDAVSGWFGNDTILGGNGNDNLAAQDHTGTNLLDGGAGDDTLFAGGGNNTLIGGSGVNQFWGGPGHGLLDGSQGSSDTAIYFNDALGVDANLTTGHTTGLEGRDDTLIGIENITGGSGNDTVTGDAGANVLLSNAGNDSLFGGAGDDSLDAGFGNDTIDGGVGIDTVGITVSSASNIVFTFRSGLTNNIATDVVSNAERLNFTSGSGNDNLTGGSDNDTLRGSDGNDSINGADGDDSLVGDSGSNTLTGGAGHDTFGGVGFTPSVDHVTDFGADDRFDISTFSFLGTAPFDHNHYGQIRYVFSGSDTRIEIDAGSDGIADRIIILDNVQIALSETSPGSHLLAFAPPPATSANDTVNGNGGPDYLDGLGGNDSIYGADGNDTLFGRDGNDTVYGGFGGDVLDAGIGNDLLDGGGDNDTLDGGADIDTALYSGPRSDYAISSTGLTYTISDSRNNSPDGTDVVSNVEFFHFLDGTLAADQIAKPDLSINTLTVGPSVAAGGTESISFSIINSGAAPAAATTTKLYLSTDATLDANDTLIGAFSTPALALGSSSSVNTSTVIPAGLAPGAYDIIAVADANNLVTNEISETNNALSAPFAVTAAPVVLEANGATTLALSANHFYLLQNGSGPSLKMSGQDVAGGQFGDWTPIAAETTGSGYEVAWKSLGSNLYSLWNTDANGNYVANIVGGVSGSDPTLSSAESFFQQDLNGDGHIASAMAPIETNGATTLALSANHFYMLHNGSGPSLKFSGQDVAGGQFGDWTPIAAEATGSGYEVAWKSLGSNTYSLWNTDANGNYVANIVGGVSGSDPTLLSAESLFQQDLNGDGQIASAMAPIETHGTTTLAFSANHYYLLQNGSGPSLKFSGQDVAAGQFGDWTPIAAEKTGSGYEVAWKSLGSNLYSLWNTDANGNYLANIVGGVSGSDPTLLSAESLFQQDLNGDGQIASAMAPIETNGTTTLALSANHFYLLHNGTGPSLKMSGQDVASGQFGDWTPIAAETTGSGYEIAWKSPGSNMYSLWTTDANGNYIGNIGGAVSGSDPALLSAESFFQQDLNGDGHWP